MTYNDYLDKSDEVDVNDWTYEEIQDFTNLIMVGCKLVCLITL